MVTRYKKLIAFKKKILGVILHKGFIPLTTLNTGTSCFAGCKENHFYSLPFRQAEATILDKIKWNSKPPSHPNQG